MTIVQEGLPPAELFIGGAWRTSADGSTFDVFDPSDASVLGTVPNGTVEDAIAAVDAAAGAAPEWAATAPRVRG